jgi:CheY-like chemotaxis protein/nitrogen-specific signal transduction histidine kinase
MSESNASNDCPTPSKTGSSHSFQKHNIAESWHSQVEELTQADHRKDEFLAMLTHELRNPLAPIQNALQIMRQVGIAGPVAERAREMLERNVKHLTRLVDDLLDVSRLRSGEIVLRKEDIQLQVLLNRAIESVRGNIETRGHTVEVDVTTEPLILNGDAVRLEQAITNVLNNAAKFTDPGGRICLQAGRQQSTAVVRITDNGIGMAAETLSKLFVPFMQGDHSLERMAGGLGIGLALARRLVELHGGSISAYSAGVGQGSRFEICLPLSNIDGARPERHLLDAPKPNSRCLKVLVVDDNKDAAKSLATVLRLWGHEVRTAYDGMAALELAKGDCPDLVFLDIGIPLMDGYQVARQLRAEDDLKGSLLIALTGYGQEDDRRRSQEAGFDLHLTKPLGAEQLQQVLSMPSINGRLQQNSSATREEAS